MSARWSRLVAALAMMAAVVVAGSASASGAPAQDRPAVGGNVGSQPVGVYDAVLPEVVPVVGSATAGSVAAVARIAAAHVYDAPAVSRVGSALFPAESPFSQVTAGKRGAISPPVGVEGAVMTPAVLIGTPSGTTVRHGPLNPGPLADDVANTFRSGTYNAVTSSNPTTLYRVYSDPARQLGPYWTRTRPTGPTQSIIDNALDPAWGNRATSWVEVRVPAGTTFSEGPAAAQRGLVGGGNQVVLPWVDDAWVVRSGGF
ncbi:MAG: hypothetical protein WBA45_03155 [Microthrixaceae bacterium]